MLSRFMAMVVDHDGEFESPDDFTERQSSIFTVIHRCYVGHPVWLRHLYYDDGGNHSMNIDFFQAILIPY